LSAKGKLSNYNDLVKIGSGGMSNVYGATHPLLKRRVVIKELNEKLSCDPLLLERFTREAVTLAGMYHQNIIHVYDFWVTKTNRYIVMEYVDGEDLNKTLERTGNLPPPIAINIGTQILSALNYAHKKGVIHRDVKPHNIMISINGEAKLMDFGIVIKQEDRSLTRPGTIIGTPNYMSPEQVVGDTLDFSSDIFSFGVLMYEMLTGGLPFEEGPDGSVFTKIRTYKPVPMKAIKRNIPASLCRIVNRCLAKDPKRRYPSTLELLNNMERFLRRELKGLDINEHLMKFLLEKDLYKRDPYGAGKNLERTQNFTQKVTKIVREREEEFRVWRRQEFFRRILSRVTIVGTVLVAGWLVYAFSTRYFKKPVANIKKPARIWAEKIKGASKSKKRFKKTGKVLRYKKKRKRNKGKK